LKALTCPSNPWDPFTNATEFRFAGITTIHEANQGLIDDLLKDDSGLQLSIKQSLKSTYILKQKIDKICDGLGHGSWCKQTTNLFWNKSHQQPIEFYSRNILICAKWLLKQKGYQHDLVYAPEK
jgi:hypothetical protein